MTDHYDQRPHQTLAPLQGNLSDVLVPNPHAHNVDPNGGHSFALHVHTGEHSHFHGVTDGGAHSHGALALTPVAMGHPVGVSRSMDESKAVPQTPEIGPLRLRLFADGSLVVDNPARPLAVYPVAHVGAHEADPITLTLDGALAAGLPVFLKSLAKV